jgi:hypothetical protein
MLRLCLNVTYQIGFDLMGKIISINEGKKLSQLLLYKNCLEGLDKKELLTEYVTLFANKADKIHELPFDSLERGLVLLTLLIPKCCSDDFKIHCKKMKIDIEYYLNNSGGNDIA